ncbi:MAG: hypothetical protein IT436_16805 [Phycisphaerales bacterium]|nr:hypothetical protein [Phycisphaerales bacterium]
MLVLNPRVVKFGSVVWDGVLSVAIDRLANRKTIGWTDAGPHATFADIPEQRIEVRITQELTREDLAGPIPGQQAELVLYTSPTSSEAGRRKVSLQAVVVQVSHELSLKKGAVRMIELVAVSATGAGDPVTISDAGAAA